MTPTIGRSVHYVLSESDAEQINRRRTNGGSIADRIAKEICPAGAQAHIGNVAEAGQVFPATIVRVWGDTEGASVNLQVLLDGNDVFWATSRNQHKFEQGETLYEGGTWHWPPLLSVTVPNPFAPIVIPRPQPPIETAAPDADPLADPQPPAEPSEDPAPAPAPDETPGNPS